RGRPRPPRNRGRPWALIYRWARALPARGGRGFPPPPAPPRAARGEPPPPGTRPRPPPLQETSLTERPDTFFGRVFRGPIMWVLLVLAALAVFIAFAGGGQKPQDILPSRFNELVAEGQVAAVTFIENSQVIDGILKTGDKFETTYLTGDGPNIAKTLDAAGVKYETPPPRSNPWLSLLLTTLLPIIAIVAVLLFVMNRMQGGGGRVMSFGKS